MSDSIEDCAFEIGFCRSILSREPDNLIVMEMLAAHLTKVGEIDEGLELDQRIVKLDPGNAINHYNLACSFALKNKAPEALASLRVAFEQGYDDFKWLLDDPDLKGLHGNPSFSALLSEFQAQEPS